MKKLSIEEKAKAYDEAIEKFDVILNLNTVKESGTIFADDVRKIFPELAESEDERIRKDIISYLKSSTAVSPKTWIEWLEKQGEKINAIENFDTEFEKQVSYLIASAISKEHEYNQGYVKWTANALLNYAKHELEKQGEQKPVVAEIERRNKEAYGNEWGWAVKCETYSEILSFIDTLETKEVDFEKELKSWRHNHFHGRRDKEASGEYLERISQLELAKHFFELGLKVAQKGEEV